MSDGSRFVLPYQTVIDNLGVPLPGAFLFFYASGTSTFQNTYSDENFTTPNSNPVQANAAGMFSNIFLLPLEYKVVLTDSDLNQVWTADPVLNEMVAPFGFSSAATQTVTADGTTTILATTTLLIFNKAVLSNSPCNLPDGTLRDLLPLFITDFTGMAGDIILHVFGAQKFMGSTADKIVASSGGAPQTGGTATIMFTSSLPGWIQL